jgi:hypothetical protein
MVSSVLVVLHNLYFKYKFKPLIRSVCLVNMLHRMFVYLLSVICGVCVCVLYDLVLYDFVYCLI